MRIHQMYNTLTTMTLRLLASLSAAAALAILPGCFRPDHRAITVAVPQMTSPACFNIIQQALKNVEGIEGVVPGYEKRVRTVNYFALKLGIKNIEFVIAGAGFDANDTQAPPSVRANLPEGCR